MTRTRHSLLLIAVAGLVAALAATTAAFPDAQPHSAVAMSATSALAGPSPTLIVRARSASHLGQAEAFVRARGYVTGPRLLDIPSFSAKMPAGKTLGAAAAELSGRNGILYIEPSYPLKSADVPADPLYTRQQPYLSKIKAPEAWDIETGKASVIVAVLDTGVDISHPDLKDRIYTNAAETPNNNVDDDNNGCIDDVNGCAFVTSHDSGCAGAVNGFIKDDSGHGTFVSGIIAASGNGQGMVGVARGVTILPVKVLDCFGSGDSLALTQGILYAARQGAKVINISLGGDDNSILMQEAVRIARDKYGVLIVAAAGNSGSEGVTYPAKFPEVLAVGAASSANADKRAVFSSTGSEVDVVAVGQGIVGTVPASSCRFFLPCIGGQPYAQGDGTSFSAPQVTGLVALILSRRPGISPVAISDLVKTTADPIPGGATWAGAGRINMLNALKPQFRLGVPGISRN